MQHPALKGVQWRQIPTLCPYIQNCEQRNLQRVRSWFSQLLLQPEGKQGVVGTGLSPAGSILRTTVIIWTKASLVPKWLSHPFSCFNWDQLFFHATTTRGKKVAVKDLRCSSPKAGPSHRCSWRSVLWWALKEPWLAHTGLLFSLGRAPE